MVAAPPRANGKNTAVGGLFYVLESVSDPSFRSRRGPAASTGLERQPPPSSHGTPTRSLKLHLLFSYFAAPNLYFDVRTRTADGH